MPFASMASLCPGNSLNGGSIVVPLIDEMAWVPSTRLRPQGCSPLLPCFVFWAVLCHDGFLPVVSLALSTETSVPGTTSVPASRHSQHLAHSV
jgi:hypothetical protein